ncbi:MAG: SLC13 family permease [Candidatus Thorarchaeota archaeon]
MILPWGSIVLLIFIVTVTLIVSKKIDMAAMALFGMALSGVVVMVGTGLTFEEYVKTFSWDAVLFVTATLIIVSVAGSSGLFQYLALQTAHLAGNDPKRVYVSFLTFIFIISLFFDPFPTMLIMAPFTIQVCRLLDIDFEPLLVSEFVVANFASVPSPVGSIQNVVIAFAAQEFRLSDPAFSFDLVAWVVILLPLSVALFVATIPILLRFYRSSLGEPGSSLFKVHDVATYSMIRNGRDFATSVIGMGILILGFLGAPSLGISPGLIALTLASVMLMLSRDRAGSLLQELSWDAVFYIIAIVGLVEALRLTGFTSDLSFAVNAATGNNELLEIALLAWVPGTLLSPVDSIPISVLFSELAMTLGHGNTLVPLALIVGTNTASYLVPMGGATSAFILGVSDEHGGRIHLRALLRLTVPLGLFHLGVSSAYLFILAILGPVWAVVVLVGVVVPSLIAMKRYLTE